jgi:deferrochelatase/peroxidase EfeB
MAGWNALTVEQQERIIGRKKMTNIELDADVKPSCSHSSLTTIVITGRATDEHVFQHLFDGRRAARITDKIGTKLARVLSGVKK